MAVQRSTKHRSLGIDPKFQLAECVEVKRPSLGERHRSAPLGPKPRRNLSLSTLTSSAIPQDSIGARTSSRYITDNNVRHDRATFNLVVIGNSGVGKTTFIRNALNLDRSVSTKILSSRVCLDSVEYRVRLCEINCRGIRVGDGHKLKWPNPIGDDLLPSVDGVLCLYDLTDENSITGIPQILHALSRSRIPVMLVACKADAPITEQEIGIAFIERIRRSNPLATFGEASSTSVESATKCLNIALKTILAIDKLQSIASEGVDEHEPLQLMELRTSDFVPTYTMAPFFRQEITGTDELRARIGPYASSTGIDVDQTATGDENSPPIGEETSQAAKHHEQTQVPVVAAVAEDVQQIVREKPVISTDDSTSDKSAHSGDQEGGVPFSDLVKRLLTKPTTKNQAKFVPAFLCLYRTFATPRRLLAEIMHQFSAMEESDLDAFTKMAELLRYLQVLVQWAANYPGDFAESPMRRRAISFAQDLEQTKSYAPSAKEFIANLLTIIMDDDRDWAYEDNEDNEKLTYRRSTRSSFYAERLDSFHQPESDTSDNDRDARRRSVRNSGSESTASSVVRSSVTSSQSATNLFNLDNAREQSKLLKSVPHIPVSKLQWHQLMSWPTEDLAQEITRMDWTMYSAVRARDFVRHVSLSSQRRARTKHADTIGMMVKHFNHLALFVSSMILLRDKPKHRAVMLEKFMDLAWKVRQLNNYNSLGAIVAGITGPEISRLKQTYELVPATVQKQFLRLTVLMSISRSHAAYRMAWDNSFAERIPFIPLVRQDLTMTANANPTFIGKNINWKKFEIMGDVIVGIQRSHEQPYQFQDKSPRSQEITRIILETKVIKESEDSADPRCELYERSVQLEPATATDSKKSMANFGVKRTMTGWFQS